VLEPPLFFFLARLKFRVLMLKIMRWFSYFLSVVSKSRKTYHTSNNNYCTHETSSTFHQNLPFFCSTSGFHRLDAIDHIVHKSRATKQRNRFKILPRAITGVKFS
jgi:hypothetical protein